VAAVSIRGLGHAVRLFLREHLECHGLHIATALKQDILLDPPTSNIRVIWDMGCLAGFILFIPAVSSPQKRVNPLRLGVELTCVPCPPHQNPAKAGRLDDPVKGPREKIFPGCMSSDLACMYVVYA
jgi:hypothetical protein